MLLCVTVRELSVVLSFCQFCDFLIYNSVRFVYISVTLLFTLFFLYLPAKIHALPFAPCHLRHEWQVIDFKQIFLVMSVAKTRHARHQNVKLLILKGFFIDKCVMSLFNSVIC